MSPGLLRARREFRLRNAATGLVLAGFVSAVWAYSIRSVKQETFDDIDEEARVLAAKRTVQPSEPPQVEKVKTDTTSSYSLSRLWTGKPGPTSPPETTKR